ncbi:unnamed protein product [Brugia timori]|uniref:Uncharacterized protein n=1 Tax=Brugia timori TaxID=42155 RepID=A0A3P7VJK2_9BILA|nr:unnamed protein product [Brugia timori]
MELPEMTDPTTPRNTVRLLPDYCKNLRTSKDGKFCLAQKIRSYADRILSLVNSSPWHFSGRLQHLTLSS